jgi:hypothetical protein
LASSRPHAQLPYRKVGQVLLLFFDLPAVEVVGEGLLSALEIRKWKAVEALSQGESRIAPPEFAPIRFSRTPDGSIAEELEFVVGVDAHARTRTFSAVHANTGQ